MEDEPKIPVAKVDVQRVSLAKKKALGIDYSNEIDVWAKMEFRAREQIKRLKSKSDPLEGHEILQDINTLVYAIREKLD